MVSNADPMRIFRDFLHKLTEDRHFAMDFWAFTGKLTSREGGALSDQSMLAVVVEGITGSEHSECRR